MTKTSPTPLRSALLRVRKRLVIYRIWQLTATAFLILAILAAWVRFAPARLVPPPPDARGSWWFIGFNAALAGLLGLVLVRVMDRSPRVLRATARRIEGRFPELDSRLLTALELDLESRPGRVVGFLPATVIREALEHDADRRWNAVMPNRRLVAMQVAWAGLFLLVMGLVASLDRATAASKPPPAVAATGPASPTDVTVEPGDAEVERGLPLLVVARFGANVPGNARLVVQGTGDAAPTPSIGMARSLEDPTFAGRIEAVDRDATYRVAFDGGTSPTYRVKVFTFPEVRRVDAQLTFPGYTGLESRTLTDVRHVSAVEGTTLGLSIRLNKQVATARLVDEKGQATPLVLVPGSDESSDRAIEPEPTYAAAWTLSESHRLKVELVDRDGRKPRATTELAINVSPNRPPTVTLTRPGRDSRVSPVEELTLQARTEDDFGVVRHGISVTDPAGKTTDLVLDAAAPAARRRVADHRIAFEGLNAQPDDLLSYHFWAEDVGPDGQARRTAGDLFFAEVRAFEEVFRQGEAPPSGSEAQQGQGQQAGQQAQKLAELQKQIIAATWTLVRRETDPDPGPEFAADATAIRESQAAAIEQATEMGQALRDAKSKSNLEAAVRAMRTAEGRLTEAVNGLDITKLQPALAAEQLAYQALLKLRAREFEVSRRRQQQQQGGGGGSASQEQLDELELSNDENRYEEQKSARAQKDAASKADAEKRETRQVLNRLAELARRQADLNERLKELQAALQAAQTPEAKLEAERQLKRLRDQEQQILRDTDETRERMEREENRERMAEARPQIDQGREQVRQAAEALERGQVSQALNQGARAERQLTDLREDLRRKSSDRFGADVAQMRDDARRLAEQQTKLTDQLRRWDEQSRQSLRDPAGRQQVGADLARQKQELDKLMDQMRQTVAEAEETEPLLARELFEATRRATATDIPKEIGEADQLARAGLPEEASRSSARAAEGLATLRDGVDRAARSILGDESAALRRAQAELDDLAEQANRGLARTDPPADPNARRVADAQNRADDAPRIPGPTGQGDLRAGADRPADADQPGSERRAEANEHRNPVADPSRQPDPSQARDSGDPRPGAGQRPGGRDRPDQQPGDRPRPDQAPDLQDQPQQPGAGQQRGPGQQPGGGQPRGQGRQPGPPSGQQPGQPDEQPGQGQGQTRDESGQQPGDPGQPGGQQSGRGGQPQAQPGGGGGAGGNSPNALDRMMEGFEPASQAGNQGQAGGSNRAGGGNGGGGNGARQGAETNPITGEGFRRWSDRLRDVEELLDSPDLRAEAARIRDRARGARDEARRHAAPLDPDKLKEMVADPIRELRDRVAEEVRRRESPDALVPIDRDPVPPRFAEGVRRYYERLGSGR